MEYRFTVHNLSGWGNIYDDRDDEYVTEKIGKEIGRYGGKVVLYKVEGKCIEYLVEIGDEFDPALFWIASEWGTGEIRVVGGGKAYEFTWRKEVDKVKEVIGRYGGKVVLYKVGGTGEVVYRVEVGCEVDPDVFVMISGLGIDLVRVIKEEG